DHPYAVPDRCFTVRGERAIVAMNDLLLTTYRVLRHGEPGAQPIDAEEELRGFLARNLRSVKMDADTQPPFWNEREWVPAFLFGFHYRPRPIPDAYDFAFLAGSTVFTDVTLPLTPLLEVEAGCRRIRSHCELELGVQTSLLVPLTEGFSLGVTPLSVVG